MLWAIFVCDFFLSFCCWNLPHPTPRISRSQELAFIVKVQRFVKNWNVIATWNAKDDAIPCFVAWKVEKLDTPKYWPFRREQGTPSW